MMIVISGSSGFIGQNLLKKIPNAKGVSLRDSKWRESFCSSEVIINLVGKAHDHDGKCTQKDYYYANVTLLKEQFNQFIQSASKVFIHVSSIAAVEEYGRDELLTETALCKPVSWYGKSKREAEEWLLSQPLAVDKKLIILRPPMIHGPGDKGNLGLLYKFISKGIPYPLAAFNNRRSFIGIDNFAFFIESIIFKYQRMESGIYNISDNETLSTNEVIEVIEDVLCRNIIKVALPKNFLFFLARIGDMIPLPLNSKKLKKLTSNLIVSNAKIKQSLDIINLKDAAKGGLKKTLGSFRTDM